MKVDQRLALRMEVHSTIDSSTIFPIVDLEQLVVDFRDLYANKTYNIVV